MIKRRVVTPFQERGHEHARCIADALSTAEAQCLERGQRLTELRRRVLELVWSSHEPVKAYDLLDRLRGEHPGAAPPTVYRALEFLLKEGLVHRIESLNAFVGCGEPGRAHGGQFLICRACSAVAEMDDAEVTRVLADRAAALGFTVERGTIELSGLCKDCRGAAVAAQA